MGPYCERKVITQLSTRHFSNFIVPTAHLGNPPKNADSVSGVYQSAHAAVTAVRRLDVQD